MILMASFTLGSLTEQRWYALENDCTDDGSDGSDCDANSNSYTTGKVGTYALVVNDELKSGSELEAPALGWSKTSDFTLAMWVNKVTFNGAGGTWESTATSMTEDGKFHVIWATNNENKFYYALGDGSSGANNGYLSPTDTYTADTWHHIVFRYNGSSDQVLSVYVDGSSLGTISWNAGWTGSANDLVYSFSAGSSGRVTTTEYDDIRIYDEVIDNDAITLLYNDGDGTTESLADLISSPTPSFSDISPADSTSNANLSQIISFKVYDAEGSNANITTKVYFKANASASFDLQWEGIYANNTQVTVNNITGLEYNTQYDWYFNLTNDAGESNQSQIYTFTTIGNQNPSIDAFSISNTLPIVTNDVIDAQFQITDNENDTVNISLTWFKSDDNSTWTAHTTDDESWLNQASDDYIGTTYHTSATGDLESADTTAWQWWKAQLTVTDVYGTNSTNTTEFQITNNPPEVTSNSSGTTFESPANENSDITFTISGTDAEDDLVKLKVCQNEGDTWDSCTLLCEDSTGVTFNSVIVNDITCTYTVTEENRSNIAYAILYDGGNYSSAIPVNYYVNHYPTLENFVLIDTTLNNQYYFGESLDYFRIDLNDTFDNSTLTPYITVKDPDGVIKIDNAEMTTLSGITKVYDTDLFLDAIGLWSVNITVTDSDGATTEYHSNFTVNVVQVTTSGRIYGYDFEGFPTYSTINQSMIDYQYYVSELRINSSTTWSNLIDILQTMKNESQVAVITWYDDLSNHDQSMTYISDHYKDLIGSDVLNAIRMLKIIVPDGTTANDANSEFINNISKRMFQNISNTFPIYLRGYNHSGLNSDYVRVDPYSYITASDIPSYISTEMGYLRNTTSTSRMYYDMNDSVKGSVLNFQNNIISKLRSSIQAPSYSDTNVSELSNGDIIIGNPTEALKNYTITLNTDLNLSGYDVYDISRKRIVEKDNDGEIVVEVAEKDFSMLYFTNLTKIITSDDGTMTLYSEQIGTNIQTQDLSQNASNAFQFVSSSANPEDGRLIMTDPSYEYPDFYVWYGTGGYESIANWSVYDIVIIADTTQSWAGNVSEITDAFGYVSVNDYGNNNDPPGCTAGVDCTSWNRTAWIEAEKIEIDNWVAIHDEMDIFIDGLDIGAVNDVDGEFGDALVELTHYVKNSKLREVILNTYTAYADYANLGDYTMRESACARWDGSVNSPTYSYEDFDLDVQRADFHKRHGITVLAQSFGAITDHEKSYYCFMQNKVLYGDLMKYGYNQPDFEYTDAEDDFQWNWFKYPDLGVALEDDYTNEGGDLYSRKFENGIVKINSSSRTVEFDDDRVISNMQFCSYYYDNDDGSSDEGYMHFVINDNTSRFFNVSDTDLTAFVKTWKCENISTDWYEPSGFYELEFYYIDADGNYLNNNGLYMYHGHDPGNDRLSFWESTLNDHPSNDETDYWYFVTGDNWATNFTINRGALQSSLDEVESVIDRSTSGVEKLQVSYSSDAGWDLPVYDRKQFMNKTRFNGIYVGDNQSTLIASNGTSCDTSAPQYAETLVGSSTWKACQYNASPSGYYVKVVIPHLSEQNYTIDGNTEPTVENETIRLLNLTEGNQTWMFEYTYTDADNNNLSTCKLNVSGTIHESSPSNNYCNITLNQAFNASLFTANVIVEDEYDTASLDGTTYNLSTIVYDGIQTSSQVGNLTVQYFLKYWNITSYNGDFVNVSWNYENLTTKEINILTGTQRDYLNYSTNLITYTDYHYTPDGSGAYTVNGGETVFRYFNVTANLSTGETVPEFNISLEMEKYKSGTQSMQYGCGSYDTFNNYSSGDPMVARISSISDGSTDCLFYSYQGKVISSDSTVIYSTVGDVRTYWFNNTEGSGYGRKIEFMFPDLANSSNDLTDSISYSTLTNWDSKLSSAEEVYYYDSSSYTMKTSGVDYTYTDVSASSLIKFEYTNLDETGLDAIYENISWSASVTTYQCNNGIDDDGDGLIDYPDDPGCSSATDDSENSDADTGDDGGSSGGGGGGSVYVPSLTVSDTNTCDIDFSTKIVKLYPGKFTEKITIFNNDDQSFKPSFSFSGDEEFVDLLEVTNIVEVLPGKSIDFGISYTGKEMIEGEAVLTLKDSSCGTTKILIQGDIGSKSINIIEELFDDSSNVIAFLKEPVFSENQPIREQTQFFNVGIVLLLSILLLTGLLWVPISKAVRQEKYGKTAIWILFMIPVSFVTTIFVVTAIRYIGG